MGPRTIALVLAVMFASLAAAIGVFFMTMVPPAPQAPVVPPSAVVAVEQADAARNADVARNADAPAAATKSAPPPAGAYGEIEATPDGIGRTYFGREIAHFMSHQGIGWLERDSREAEERTSALIDALGLEPGMCVADVGAGSGRLTLPMARRVVPGVAYGTDIQPEMLKFLEARAREEGLTNLKGILGDTDDVMLPEGTVDLVLLVDAYHEFDRPWEMMQSIRRALKPGGRVALVEFRAEDPEVPIKALHKMTEAQARREFEAAGFRWVSTDPRLPWQHLMWFER